MTATNWVTRVVSALLALTLLVGSLLAVVEIVAAALGRAPALISYAEWTGWLRTHSWNDGPSSLCSVGSSSSGCCSCCWRSDAASRRRWL